MNPCEWSVVIVGGGPVGMTLANLLGVYGVRTLVLESEGALFDRPRAVGTDFECLRAWQAAGLHEKLLGDMIPSGRDGMGLVYLDRAGRRFLEVRPNGREYGFAVGYGFIQPLVDRALLEGAGRFESVEVRFGHRVESAAQDEQGVTVSGFSTAGEPFSIRGHYVVACDGGRSAIRRGLGIRMVGSTYGRRWLVLDTREPDVPGRNLSDVQIWCDPERPAVTVPRLHGHRRWEFLERPGETAEELLEPATIRALLGQRADPGDVEVIRKLVYRFQARLAERFRQGRILLAGDAAHVTPPFAGQGLAIGIRDAFNLGWKLALVSAGKASPGLLDTYPEERRPNAASSIALAVWLGRIMMPRTPLRAALVQGVVRTLSRSRRVREFMMEGGPRPAPRYRSGYFVRSRRPRNVAGRMAHQPQVRRPNGERILLDECLGAGFAVVGFGSDPRAALSAETLRRWSDLGTRFVTVVPAERARGVPDALEDVDGGFARWLGRTDERLLVIRPDRFVAADCRRAEAGRVLGRLDERLRARPESS
ncbi:MAG: bifunctional 3-(3-hydroxy-phenyl)propionate/3-hydroxycinnamic acid hydroxylase [Deltaproteobacteria bacterium]|nr:MAG: bifunctional 3-(3-hydroxy-phenyl)propionate/3-hydroxycinnamic acid hydroxylase [Deltaproteobacteria bacterium]